jgi:hypothetical protein
VPTVSVTGFSNWRKAVRSVSKDMLKGLNSLIILDSWWLGRSGTYRATGVARWMLTASWSVAFACHPFPCLGVYICNLVPVGCVVCVLFLFGPVRFLLLNETVLLCCKKEVQGKP